MAGEDKKTLTIFSSLAKNSVKFFSQNRYTRAFLLLFATSPTSTATAATCPLKCKKLPFTVVNACGRWYITCEMVGHYNVKGEIWLR